jgi:hypothetical protein
MDVGQSVDLHVHVSDSTEPSTLDRAMGILPTCGRQRGKGKHRGKVNMSAHIQPAVNAIRPVIFLSGLLLDSRYLAKARPLWQFV